MKWIVVGNSQQNIGIAKFREVKGGCGEKNLVKNGCWWIVAGFGNGSFQITGCE